MASDLVALIDAISHAQSIRPYYPEDREAEAAKIVRLRQLRLAKSSSPRKRTKPLRGLIMTR